jgi:hypothetical protein
MYTNQTLRIRFLNEIGADAGGLTREFLTIISTPLFGRAFSIGGDGDIFWLPHNSECPPARQNDLLAAGLLIRFALDVGERLNAPLPMSLFRKLKGEPMTFDDYQIIPSRPEIWLPFAVLVRRSNTVA